MKALYSIHFVLILFAFSITFLSSEKAINNQIAKSHIYIDISEEYILAPGRFHLNSLACPSVDSQLCCCGCVGVDCGIISAVCDIPAIMFICVKGGPFECGSELGCDSIASGADCVSCCNTACGP